LISTALSVEVAHKAIEGDPSSASQQLEQAHDLIADATDRMYDLILGLRPSVLDDLGLLAALRAHTERTLQPEGIAVEIDGSGLSKRLPPHLETALFRIFQEAISNIVRHAHARHVTRPASPTMAWALSLKPLSQMGSRNGDWACSACVSERPSLEARSKSTLVQAAARGC